MNSLRQKGFTLIELLVVISIIGLLSSVVIVSLQGARAKGVNARIKQASGQMRTVLELERTNAGYAGLASHNNIAVYGSISTEMRKIVDDVLKQQGKTAATGYPGGASSTICPGSNPSLTGTEGVVISTNAVGCAQPTEYAIYAALSPAGSGYTCIDSKSGRGSATTGGIPTNGTPGVCSGTSGGGGGGSLALPNVESEMYEEEFEQYTIIRFYVSNSDNYAYNLVGGNCSLEVESSNNGSFVQNPTQYTGGVITGNPNAEVYMIEVNAPYVPAWDVTVKATCTVGTDTVIGYGSYGE